MSTGKSNKKEPNNGLYTLLTAGQLFHVSAHCLGGGWMAVRKTYR